ncbi:hypothetical protein CXG81DRAFT_8651 [Caulochytrium protostelioides]|uniref:Dipeptidyl peptidase 3 n=1 Tax=Caulochytrium protostelioides TaxID=1555241 RepID=A0A4P9XEZ5_9FUNG|nr:hypothetical protein CAUPRSCDRAFT_5435 [Caulochytrium protostelioides]RKP04108.1 hypothetical protein CXG81DRAFT_8651 [Caulochytrium protostelioides]|eukprot:RKP04108.1 hypothetical protein CXG81DRAFT_8651 [Caulochytrium protostelioides]
MATSVKAGSEAAKDPLNQYYADRAPPFCQLVVQKHFEGLTPEQKHYTYHIQQAAWAGWSILGKARSPVSLALCELFEVKLFRDADTGALTDLEALRVKTGLNADEFCDWMDYAVAIIYNRGNFRSFGDTKILPRLSQNRFRDAIIAVDPANAAWADQWLDQVYESEGGALHLGFTDKGHVSGFYEGKPSHEELTAIQKVLEAHNFQALNTRVRKIDDKHFQVMCGSVKQGTRELENTAGLKVELVFGEHADALKQVAYHLGEAAKHAANAHQKAMLDKMVEHFTTGDGHAYDASQIEWIKDKGPAVESNIGWIETYSDPLGVRGDWEGFVAVVNKELTQRFQALVDRAPEFLVKLPWGPDFEKAKFNKPDFTSLEVVTFCTSGNPPAGINIPNPDWIREKFGFKNVSLANVMSAKTANEVITFVPVEQRARFDQWRGPAFDVQVGLHELLGHGSAKLFTEEADGTCNFSRDLIHPLTGKPITSWYKPGQSWGSVFGALASTYEECRAESVGLHLSVEPAVLQIFHFTQEQDQRDLIWALWMNMARAGLLALEYYSPTTCTHGQAHMQGRYALLKNMRECGLVKIVEHPEEGLLIDLNEDLILTKGHAQNAAFLRELQIHKSTADVDAARAFYNKWTSVPDEELRWRDIVLAKRQARKVFVQGCAFPTKDKADYEFKQYPATREGFLQSYIERNLH